MLHLHWKCFSESSNAVYADFFPVLLSPRLVNLTVISAAPVIAISVVGDCVEAKERQSIKRAKRNEAFELVTRKINFYLVV